MRLFKYPTQGSTLNVVKLAIHLPGQSAATYRANASNAQIRRLIRRGEKTTLAAFFMLCLADPEVAGKMLYKDIPTVYHWDKKSKWWVQYKKYVPSICHIVHVSPQDPKRFYLRLLLCYRHGPTSFEDLRTIDGVTYATFHEAALAAGYLDNDSEWLLEASNERMPYQLRQLFGIILVYSLPNSPLALWERFKNGLSEDFQREFGSDMDDRKVEYKTLQSLDNILSVNGKTLENYGLPVLQDYELEAAVDEQDTGDLIQQELNAHPLEQLVSTVEMVTQLNANQQDIFDQVISAIETPEMAGKLFFIDGSGGTGKSFLLEQIVVLGSNRLIQQIADLNGEACVVGWNSPDK
ncbi:Helitron helicase-like protein [Phytophthora palmivora]|uniref:ATP-dependent DNA helicase n=1 Tax=Phytophthora palmivora TaxID=4796 RepID=A0A2P4XH23_9STRA|nr:Helitron helicase-like protein [Phytophthora palmivora]